MILMGLLDENKRTLKIVNDNSALWEKINNEDHFCA